jgi:glucose-1-phosphatase
MDTIVTVLFDLGNVLAHIDFDNFWRTLGFLTHEEITPFAEGYRSCTRRYETGLIPTSEYLTELQSVFHHRFSQEQLTAAFQHIILDPVVGMAELAESVSRTRRTALASNTNDMHYSKSLKQYTVMQALHRHYCSYQMHVMKPAREFYDFIIRDQQVAPSELLFIDDLDDNIEGARTAGMQAIKFEGVMKLEKKLKQLQVLM